MGPAKRLPIQAQERRLPRTCFGLFLADCVWGQVIIIVAVLVLAGVRTVLVCSPALCLRAAAARLALALARVRGILERGDTQVVKEPLLLRGAERVCEARERRWWLSRGQALREDAGRVHDASVRGVLHGRSPCRQQAIALAEEAVAVARQRGQGASIGRGRFQRLHAPHEHDQLDLRCRAEQLQRDQG